MMSLRYLLLRIKIKSQDLKWLNGSSADVFNQKSMHREIILCLSFSKAPIQKTIMNYINAQQF